MENYSPIKLNPNEVFGFTKPIESVVVGPTTTMQPDWGLIFVGGLLIVLFIYYYQSWQISELKREVFQRKGGEEES